MNYLISNEGARRKAPTPMGLLEIQNETVHLQKQKYVIMSFISLAKKKRKHMEE